MPIVLAELVLASLVDSFPKTEELERDEVRSLCRLSQMWSRHRDVGLRTKIAV